MHYHAEIIMPPTEDVEGAIAKIMEPFSENNEDARHPFWDWFVIGGRYSGSKLEALVPNEKMEAFRAELTKRNVTVSGLQWGKQELSPASQIEMVDALWREMCPGAGDVCPVFQHSGANMAMDVCHADQIPEALTAYTLIIAGPTFDDSSIEAKYLAHTSIWNGVTHQDTDYKGGTVKSAAAVYAEYISRYRDDYKEKCTIQPDWLCVTVDYHS